MEDYGNKKKGQEMTFNLADNLVGPGRSLEDLKQGAVLEFQVKEADGKHIIQAFGPPTAGGGEQGRGAGQAGQQQSQQGQQPPAQQGQSPSSQPGQEKKQYQQPLRVMERKPKRPGSWPLFYFKVWPDGGFARPIAEPLSNTLPGFYKI